MSIKKEEELEDEGVLGISISIIVYYVSIANDVTTLKPTYSLYFHCPPFRYGDHRYLILIYDIFTKLCAKLWRFCNIKPLCKV